MTGTSGDDLTTQTKLQTLAIGAAGELLVQYGLLKHGIDSARMATDSGIDLVMYVPGTTTAATIQVKTNFAPTPAGRMSRVPWNFGGGPVSIRLRSRRHCAPRIRQIRRFHAGELLGVWVGGGGR